jgi:glycine oxidase
VVGGGIIGCAVAYELARRGAAVSVVESRDIGAGATQASAGMLAPYIEAQHLSPLWTLGSRSLELYDSFVAEVVSDSGCSVPYSRTGTLQVAVDDASLARLEETAVRLSSAGVECRLLARSEALAAEPNLGQNVRGALIVQAHGFVGAGPLTTALRHAGVERGARFIVSEEANRILMRGSSMVVETAGGVVTSDSVVVASGCWTGRVRVEGAAVLPIRPVRGQLLRLLWTEARLERIVWGPGCYVVPWLDGSVLVGATVEEAGFDEGATVSGVTNLLEAVCGLLPAAQDAGFDTVRVGLRPATPDGLPAVGRSAELPDLVYATGHYRNGILLAPLTAQLVAALILDGKQDPLLDAVDPRRFA